MTRIPDFMHLSGDEDGGVHLACQHPTHTADEAWCIAYYGGLSAPAGRQHVHSLAAFVEVITSHAATHS